MQITDHRLTTARQLPSPNWNERPTSEISLIVIHGISLPVGHFAGEYVEQLFLNALETSAHPDFVDLEGVRVSSHLYIHRDGAMVQFVPFDKRAWHAGPSRFGDRENCNDFSIGIELEGTDLSHYRDEQYATLVEACSEIIKEYAISESHIVGHCDVAPGRKTDPGPGFEWDRLKRLLEGAARSATGVLAK